MKELTELGRKSPYFALIDQESEVRLSNIEKFEPYALSMVDTLMRSNLVYGQREMFSDDMILYFIGRPVDGRGSN